MPESPASSLISSGYPLKIVSGNIDKKYLCSHCHLILREPMQSFCGHRFCKNCAQALVRTGEVTCADCEEEGTTTEFSIIKEGQLFPDVAITREFLSWKVTCENPGCGWTGLFKEYESHRQRCEHQTTPCELCGRAVPQAALDKHRLSECPNRTLPCPHCHQHIPAMELKEHENYLCGAASVRCDACGTELARADLGAHYSGGACSGPPRIPCPYGCGAFVAAADLEQHEKEEVVRHVRAIHRRVAGMEAGRRERGGRGDEDEPMELSTPVQVSSEIQELRNKVVELERKVDTALGETSAQAIGPSTSSGATGGSDADTDLYTRVAALEEKMSTFLAAQAAMQGGVEQSSAKVERLKNLLDSQGNDLNDKCRRIERSLASKDLSTAELDQRIKTLEVSSYDGVLLWKITNFANKQAKAARGETTSIFSPPFYSSRTGYKMCARMYPNGDGMGKGTHVSMFFVIMRNEYDAIMRWPFRQKVTMIMVDQNNLSHKVDAFRPDPSSSSFRRPRSEMNIASGCPLFCPLSDLRAQTNAYVKDDTMYIKIIVDISDLK